MDPALIALFGTIFCGIMLKMIKNFVLHGQAKDEPKAVEVKSGDVSYCMMWGARLFEQKLVEAGIIKASEMSVCDNGLCENCAPTYRAFEKERSMREIAKKKADHDITYKRVHAKGIDTAKKFAHIRPNNVPRRATAELRYNPLILTDEICWRWGYDEGKEYSLVQKISEEALREIEAGYYAKGEEKPVQNYKPTELEKAKAAHKALTNSSVVNHSTKYKKTVEILEKRIDELEDNSILDKEVFNEYKDHMHYMNTIRYQDGRTYIF